jgi:hypothetical protein
LVAQEEEAAQMRLEQKGEKSKSKRKKQKAKSKQSKRVHEELEEQRVKLAQQKLEQQKLEQQKQERDRNGYWLQQELESARMQLDLTRATSEDASTLQDAYGKTRSAYEALRTHCAKFGSSGGAAEVDGDVTGDASGDATGADVQSMLFEVAKELEETEAELAEAAGGVKAHSKHGDSSGEMHPLVAVADDVEVELQKTLRQEVEQAVQPEQARQAELKVCQRAGETRQAEKEEIWAREEAKQVAWVAQQRAQQNLVVQQQAMQTRLTPEDLQRQQLEHEQAHFSGLDQALEYDEQGGDDEALPEWA